MDLAIIIRSSLQSKHNKERKREEEIKFIKRLIFHSLFDTLRKQTKKNVKVSVLLFNK